MNPVRRDSALHRRIRGGRVTPLSWFEAAGRFVDRAWQEVGREEEAFPAVAERALHAVSPFEGLDLDGVMAAVLDPGGALPQQLAPAGVFGQPAITGWHGGDFAIDLYCWNSSLSAIHNHPFSGLFCLLRGFSLHSRYRFEVTADLGPRARIGQLALEEVALLSPGEYELFSLRSHPLIHSLLHVPNPSLSLVIRTTRTEAYYRYLPPSVALRIGGDPPELERRLMLLDFLRRSGDPAWVARLGDFLLAADFNAAFQALARAWPDRSDDAHFDRLVDRGRERHGAALDVVAPAMRHAARQHRSDQLRHGFRDPEDRFIAAVLAHGGERQRVWALLHERYRSAAGERLLRWLDGCGLFTPDDPGLHVARMLAHDPLPEATRAADGAAASIERYFRGSILESLLP